ncbi:MAG: hypothetical protein JSV51_05385 [Candidatus Bathyarchaeota archaeon]|nr:MAG: hypothetical protein JSV51_05385 [Candidatus Bathyarchaeota archaeon]
MGKSTTVSTKIPEEVYKEFVLRVSEGERSAFIRDAIMERLQKVPRPDKILRLEERVSKLEADFSETMKYLAKLEVLTYDQGNINPHAFCIDDMDHKIVDYISHYKGATTTELAEYLKTNRWFILNRLRRIQKLSRKQLGKPIVQYCPREKMGKKKAWWMNEEITGV